MKLLGKLYIENVTMKVVRNTVLVECDAFLVAFESTEGGHLQIHHVI